MEKFEKLSRDEMKKIIGGDFGSCSAVCGEGTIWQNTVTCAGSSCEASDNSGCTAIDSKGNPVAKYCYW